eukprot:scaffold29066_cov156-Amphora_coffeaeformis.AAC.3
MYWRSNVLLLSSLLSLVVLAPRSVEAWVMVPTTTVRTRTASRTTTSLSMNIFADFFKMPSFGVSVDTKKEEMVEKDETNNVPDVENLEAQKEELAGHQQQQQHDPSALTSAAVVVEPPQSKEKIVHSEVAETQTPAASVTPDTAAQANEQLEGTVVWFHALKGYGFIHPHNGDKEDDKENNIFVHHSAIAMDGFRKVRQGQTVRYTVERDERGRTRAVNVAVVGS